MFEHILVRGAAAALIAASLASVAGIGSAAAQTRCGSAVTVAPGDTFYRIAARCGTTASALMRANPRVDPRSMRIGATIRMPGSDRVAQRPDRDRPRADGRYRIRQGDTLSRIARDLGISLSVLISSNPDIDARFLIPGVEIRVPGGRDDRGRDDGERRRVTVTGTITRGGVECPALRGDNGRLYTLAGNTRRFGPGDRVQVQGRIARSSICQQGTTIEVERMRAARDRDGDGRTMTVTGTLTREGVECPALRSDNGRLFTLAGNTGRFGPGDRVQVRGQRAEVSTCMQGTTIDVNRIRSAG